MVKNLLRNLFYRIVFNDVKELDYPLFKELFNKRVLF